MNSQKAQNRASNLADEDAIGAIHRRMIDAWNAGDGAASPRRSPSLKKRAART
jgi:hypothetical protein